MHRYGLINTETGDYAPKVFDTFGEAAEYAQNFGPEWEIEELCTFGEAAEYAQNFGPEWEIEEL